MKAGALAVVALMLTVAGCGPVYETQYQLVPPTEPQDRQCASQCQSAQSLCRNQCQANDEYCLANERALGMMEYDRYARARRREGLGVKRTPESFVNSYRCSGNSCEADCAEDYRQCYALCGGKVIPHRVCTLFCEQEPAAGVPAPSRSAPANRPGSRAAGSAALCVKGTRLQAYSDGDWYDAVVKDHPLSDGRCSVHYDGYSAEEDEIVLPSMLRPRL